ncbi:hypothetical protein [Faecalibaculum rodentium]|uniref:hypothetical protein n=1 Tax=Faecalibaculum rodentium TaxID=1702221 RepID=UPI0024945BB6|nr:hypothetical protein [Faecalibaculum rodentium]
MPIGHHTSSYCEQYELEEVAAHLLYAYLFKGLSGEEAEKLLFGKDHQKGWYTKVLLNFYGISNSREVGIEVDSSSTPWKMQSMN